MQRRWMVVVGIACTIIYARYPNRGLEFGNPVSAWSKKPSVARRSIEMDRYPSISRPRCRLVVLREPRARARRGHGVLNLLHRFGRTLSL